LFVFFVFSLSAIVLQQEATAVRAAGCYLFWLVAQFMDRHPLAAR